MSDHNPEAETRPVMTQQTRVRLAYMMAVMPTVMIAGFVATGLVLRGSANRIDGLAWRGAAGAVLLYFFFVWAIARGLRKRFGQASIR